MRRTFWALAAAVLAVFFLTSGTAEAAKSITAPDMGTNVGLHSSLALDSNGYPVVAYCASYYPPVIPYCLGDLKVLHCGNTTCTSDNTITSVESVGFGGGYFSLVLDGDGNPVVSYYHNQFLGPGGLKLLHCNDANCDPAVNGAESIQTVESYSWLKVGMYTSLALDGSGNPVISYYEQSNGILRVAHCNDPNCDPTPGEPGNGPESITWPDNTPDVGWYTSLALDSSGYPVVSYYDVTNHDLKVMHCNDANCDLAVNGAESIQSPDTENSVGSYTSLALDDSGNPVVSYYDASNGNLKVLHCTDPNCDPSLPEGNGPESITSPDTSGTVGVYTSLVLDDSGYPVVSYYDLDNGDLKVMGCNDVNCAGSNESITSPDTAGNVGTDTSVALYLGNPTVSYHDVTHGQLKTLRCGDASCEAENTVTTADLGNDVGWYTSLALDAQGKPVISYFDRTLEDLRVLLCRDANCTSVEGLTMPDTEGTVGLYTSLVLDDDGYPVVSYYDSTNTNLKVLHCGNADCGSGNIIKSPDTTGDVGQHTSLALDSNGYPVISYMYQTGLANGDLKVMHCNDPNCDPTPGPPGNGPESIFTVDTGGTASVGQYTSLALDASGNPVVGYSDYTNGDLKVLHCTDPNCDPSLPEGNGPESITSPDTSAGVAPYTSLALDASGYPVVSYWWSSFGRLKVMHCNDANCAGSNESITTPDPDTGSVLGVDPSLALDSSGKPVVSYRDHSNGNLKVMRCNDANCAGGGESITSPDTAGDVGQHTSLALDISGNAVVSYYDNTNGNLKLLHCDTASCTQPAAYPPAGTDELPVSLHFEHVWLCAEGGSGCVDAGEATFSGTGKFSRGTPYVSGTYNTIDTQVLSMVLTGIVYGDNVTVKAGTEQGLTASYGKIREQTPGTFYPADTWFDLFFRVESSDGNYNGTENCDFDGGGAEAVRFTGVTMSVPAVYVEYRVPSCPVEPPPTSCVAGCGESGLLAVNKMSEQALQQMDEQRFWCTDPSGTGTLVVGGIAEWPDTAAGSDSSADASAGSRFNYTALGAALAAAAAVAVLAAGAWLARRRWGR